MSKDQFNEQTIRKLLGQVVQALARNEDEHQSLEHLQKGYEGWLELNVKPNATQDTVEPLEPDSTENVEEETK